MASGEGIGWVKRNSSVWLETGNRVDTCLDWGAGCICKGRSAAKRNGYRPMLGGCNALLCEQITWSRGGWRDSEFDGSGATLGLNAWR